MTKVDIPLDIDHTCAEKGPIAPREDVEGVQGGAVAGPAKGIGTRPNECPACCYERGYLAARPWLVGEVLR